MYEALYTLSAFRVSVKKTPHATQAGFEPTASCLLVHNFINLQYRPNWNKNHHQRMSPSIQKNKKTKWSLPTFLLHPNSPTTPWYDTINCDVVVLLWANLHTDRVNTSDASSSLVGIKSILSHLCICNLLFRLCHVRGSPLNKRMHVQYTGSGMDIFHSNHKFTTVYNHKIHFRMWYCRGTH